MDSPFDGYTDEQAAAIRETLIAQGVKPDAQWKRILLEITWAIDDVYEGDCAPDRLVRGSVVKKQSAALRKALEEALAAWRLQPEGLQWHQNEHCGVLDYEGMDTEWPKAYFGMTGEQVDPTPITRSLTVGDLIEKALSAVRDAEQKPNPHLSLRTGNTKDYVLRGMVYFLMRIFEAETGIEPTVYVDTYERAVVKNYSGTFLPFALACLKPVFPDEALGSAIYTAYNEAKNGNSPFPVMGAPPLIIGSSQRESPPPTE